jgi:hypothetical protein
MPLQHSVDSRNAFCEVGVSELEANRRFAQAGIQKRLPYSVDHFAERFFLAGSEGNVCGDTHIYTNIG